MMKYEEFSHELAAALEESGLTRDLYQVENTLEPEDLKRTQTIWLNPDVTRTDRPFDTTARLCWTWGPIDTARSTRNEEEVLTDLLGRSGGSRRTSSLLIRVDVRICAHTRYDQEVLLPGELARSCWAAEAMLKMEACFPEKMAKIAGYPTQVPMSWLGTPKLLTGCGPVGELLVEDLMIEGWQMIVVPRKWDDPRRRPEAHPRRAMLDLCKRIAAALDSWAKATRHLLPQPQRTGPLH